MLEPNTIDIGMLGVSVAATGFVVTVAAGYLIIDEIKSGLPKRSLELRIAIVVGAVMCLVGFYLMSL